MTKNIIRKTKNNLEAPFSPSLDYKWYGMALASVILCTTFVFMPNFYLFLGAGAGIYFTVNSYLKNKSSSYSLEKQIKSVLKDVAESNAHRAHLIADGHENIETVSISSSLSDEFGSEFVAGLNQKQIEWVENSYADIIDTITGVGTRYQYISRNLDDSANTIQKRITAGHIGRREVAEIMGTEW